MWPDGSAFVALLLALAPAPQKRASASEPVHFTGDAWFGVDKVKHCALGAGVQTLSFGALRAIGATRRVAMAGAWTFTLTVSIGKEVHDARTHRLFSLKDLTWDLACAGAASLILVRTQR